MRARQDHRTILASKSNELNLRLFDCPPFGRSRSTVDVSDGDYEKATT